MLSDMAWDVNGTDEFADWFGELAESEQDEVIAVVELLAEHGPELDRPYADRIKGSKYHNMKELRPRGQAKNSLPISKPRAWSTIEERRMTDGTPKVHRHCWRPRP